MMIKKRKLTNWDVGSKMTGEEWMRKSWRDCDTCVVVTAGPSLEGLPPHLRANLPSARCLESMTGYLALAIIGRRSGVIGDGDFDIMLEQLVSTAWGVAHGTEKRFA